MNKVFSIILYIIATLLFIIGVYEIGIYLAVNYLTGQNYTGMLLPSLSSQLPILNFGSYSLILSGFLFIVLGVLTIFSARKFWKGLFIGIIISVILITILLLLFSKTTSINPIQDNSMDCESIVPNLVYSLEPIDFRNNEIIGGFDWTGEWAPEINIQYGMNRCYRGQAFANMTVTSEESASYAEKYKKENPNYIYCPNLVAHKGSNSNGNSADQYASLELVLSRINTTKVYFTQEHKEGFYLNEATFEVVSKSCSDYSGPTPLFPFRYDSLALGKSEYAKYNP